MIALYSTPFNLYNFAATTTLLLCDILDTLPRELIYIWSYDRKANWVTLFYVITRYLPYVVVLTLFFISPQSTFSYSISTILDIDEISPDPLLHFIILYNVPWFVVLGCTETLFIKRTAALYGQGALVLRVLITLFIVEMVATLPPFIFFYFDYSTPKIIVQRSRAISHSLVTAGITPTFTSSTVSASLYYAFPELAFQALLVFLVSKKALSNWRANVANSDLISIVVRDGLWSFLVNLCGLLVIIIQPLWLSGPLGLPNLLWSYVSFSVTSTRLILNIRAAAEERSKVDNIIPVAITDTGLSFGQGIRSFITSGNEELSEQYHYSGREND